MLCGALAEGGADSKAGVLPVLEKFKELLTAAKRHQDLAESAAEGDTASSNPNRPPTAEDERSAVAYRALEFMARAAVALLLRNPEARVALQVDLSLYDLSQPFIDIGPVEFFRKLLQIAPQLEVLATNPFEHWGYRIQFAQIGIVFQLFTFIQQVVEPSLSDEERTRARWDFRAWQALTLGPDHRLTKQDTAKLRSPFVNFASGIAERLRSRTELSGFDRAAHLIWGEMPSFTIPKFEGKHVVLLGPPLFGRRNWDPSFLRPLREDVNPRVASVEKLPESTVKEMLDGMLNALKPSCEIVSSAQLKELAGKVPAEGETYVMFNNLPRVGDSKRFIELL